MLKLLKKIDLFLLPKQGDFHYGAYIWLIYLGIFYISLYFHHPIEHSYYYASLATIIFLFAYFKAYRVSSKQIKWYILIILLVGSGMSVLSPGASVFFVYAASFCFCLGSSKKAFIGLIYISIWVIALVFIFKLSAYFYIPALIFSYIVGGINIYHHEIGLKHKELTLSQQEVRHLARISERERIARDLHDLIGHTFSIITLKAELAGKLINNDKPKALKEINQLENISREALKQIREVVTGYRTSDLNTELAHAKYILESNNINYSYAFDDFEIHENTNKELAIILKELITNILKHAHANRASTNIQQINDTVTLTVEDDGIGFNNTDNSGFGLRGIQERVNKLEGELSIQSQPTTRIKITIPLGNST